MIYISDSFPADMYLKVALKDINNFIVAHPNEILIVDINNVRDTMIKKTGVKASKEQVD